MSSPPTAARVGIGAASRLGEGLPSVGGIRRHADAGGSRCEAADRLVGEIGQRLVAHEHLRPGVFQQVPQLGGGETPVDRHGDRTEEVGGEDRGEELGAVVRQQADDVAGSDAPFPEPAGQPGRPLGHVPVRHGRAVTDGERLVGRARSVVLEHSQPAHVGRRRGRGGHGGETIRSTGRYKNICSPAWPVMETGTQTGGQTGGQTSGDVTTQRQVAPAARRDHRPVGHDHRPARVPRHEHDRALRGQPARQGCALLLHRVEGGAARRHPRPGDGRGAPRRRPRPAAGRHHRPSSWRCSAPNCST